MESCSSASERGGRGGSGSRGEDDERLLAALDLLDDDQTSTDFDQQPRGRSKSTRLRRKSCMVSSFTSPAGVQRATSLAESKTDRKLVSAAGPRPDIIDLPADGTRTAAVESDSADSRRNEPTKLPPTYLVRLLYRF